jgi:hypothetical protein
MPTSQPWRITSPRDAISAAVPRRRSAHIIGETARILVVQIYNQRCSFPLAFFDVTVMIARYVHTLQYNFRH